VSDSRGCRGVELDKAVCLWVPFCSPIIEVEVGAEEVEVGAEEVEVGAEEVEVGAEEVEVGAEELRSIA
jgi:hypothetical protein